MLVEELRRMGVPQVEIDEQYGYVYAKILSNRPDGEKCRCLDLLHIWILLPKYRERM